MGRLSIACHKEITETSLAVSLLYQVPKYSGHVLKTSDDRNQLVNKIVLLSTWVQVVAIVGLPMAAILVTVWYRRRKRKPTPP